jgi:hypothetical protein
MTCDKCEEELGELLAGRGKYAPFRIGNKEIGFASIFLVGCKDHLKLALERLNKNG